MRDTVEKVDAGKTSKYEELKEKLFLQLQNVETSLQDLKHVIDPVLNPPSDIVKQVKEQDEELPDVAGVLSAAIYRLMEIQDTISYMTHNNIFYL